MSISFCSFGGGVSSSLSVICPLDRAARVVVLDRFAILKVESSNINRCTTIYICLACIDRVYVCVCVKL